MSEPNSEEDKKRLSRLRVAAMNCLARREHSRHELHQKLTKAYPDTELVATVLDQLSGQGLQSDSRFAEAFLRSRYRKGQGPYRIRQELQQRGVAEPVIADAFSEESIDWYEAARDVAWRRFGQKAADDFRERSKRARFLQYRGFDNDQIQYALSGTDRE